MLLFFCTTIEFPFFLKKVPSFAGLRDLRRDRRRGGALPRLLHPHGRRLPRSPGGELPHRGGRDGQIRDQHGGPAFVPHGTVKKYFDYFV